MVSMKGRPASPFWGRAVKYAAPIHSPSHSVRLYWPMTPASDALTASARGGRRGNRTAAAAPSSCAAPGYSGEDVVQARRAGLRRHDLLIGLLAGPVPERQQDLHQRVGEPEYAQSPAQDICHCRGPAAERDHAHTYLLPGRAGKPASHLRTLGIP